MIPETPAEDQPAGPLTPVLFTPTQSSTVPPVNVQPNVVPPVDVPPTTDQPPSNPTQPTAAQVDPTVTPGSGHVPLKSVINAATRAAFGRRVAKPSNINMHLSGNPRLLRACLLNPKRNYYVDLK